MNEHTAVTPTTINVPAAVEKIVVACPFCSEMISANAKKCRHCHEIVDVTMRELQTMRAQAAASTPTVFMNSGGAASSAAAASSSSGARDGQLHPFGHVKHIVLSVLTAGFWLPLWFLFYVFRNKRYYY